jgi:signal transduction histidine kinase/DNA-binding response OmpR family regulator/CHASE3 domain sensor protein
MNSSFKRNLIIGYAVSLLLLIASSIASYVSIKSLLYTQGLVDHTHVVINKFESIISALKDAETGQRGFLLTNDAEFLQPFNEALSDVNDLIDETKNLTSSDLNQQRSIEDLKCVAGRRMTLLQNTIDNRKKGAPVTTEDLLKGKSYMDQARKIVQTMKDREQGLLDAHTESLNKFASSTPVFIVIASLLAIAVTVVSFLRINSDFEKREKLQEELQKKDEDVTKRLNVIRDIAEKISEGDYKIKVSDEGKDVLGSVSFYVNKMAESLNHSFTNLSHKEWQQTGIANLNEKMIGEKNIDVLAYNVLELITAYTQSQIGAFYLVEYENTLALKAGIALDKNIKPELAFGEGVPGQCALSRKEIILNDIDETDITINYSAGAIKPKTILAVPVFHEGVLKGVIEIASLQTFAPAVMEFVKSASYNIGVAIRSAEDRERLQELLAETQAQSEELQAQHNELENINAELEAQAERLQTSEEELKVQQEELQEANKELEERSRLLEEKNELILERNLEIQGKAEELSLSTKYKSEFLANMSHELRTPLNSILLLSRLLAENHRNNLSKEQVEYANVIQSSGKALLTLINEILDLSKIESGKMELEYSYIRVGDVMNEMKSLFEPMAKEKGIAFNVDTDQPEAETIEVDRLRLDQILRNLISNALKFTKKGSVSLTAKTDNGSISFMVKDTGIGIAKEKQQTIFEAFQQADGSTRRQYGGTGLGLSISRQLARLLGGEIELSSEEGKGSEFILTIPVKKGMKATPEMADIFEPPDIAPLIEEPVKNVNDKAFLANVIPPPLPDDRDNIQEHDKIILIIEDDTAFAKSLLEFTHQKGYKGIVAVRGDEGIELANLFHPLGILLDIQLPVKNGWQVMDELKSKSATRAIPVHIMSSFEVRRESLSTGAVNFISKPVAFEKVSDIFQKIETALSRHPKKVLIVEENPKHAKALAYFLESFNVVSEIKNSVDESIAALNRDKTDCVILDMGVPSSNSYEVLEKKKKVPGLENLPIIIFTGKNISSKEEMHIKQYADSIVVKTANSYQRILDEVSLFLHLVEENNSNGKSLRYKKMGELREVLKGKTVLVADDDVRNIFSLTKSLENYGMNVLSAIDGKEALKVLEQNKQVNIVLMDMMMPEMDGYESTRRIRQIPQYRNLPVIAVTAKAMMGDREKCINAGASDYITKPVDVDQLISLLRVWLYE